MLLGLLRFSGAGADRLGGLGVGALLASEDAREEDGAFVDDLVEVGAFDAGAFKPLLRREGLGLLATVVPFGTECSAEDLGCFERLFDFEDGAGSFD